MSEEERINKNAVLAAAKKARRISNKANVRDTLENIVYIYLYNLYIYIYIFCFVFILILFFILYFI